MVLVIVPPFQLRLKVYAQGAVPDAAVVARPSLINYVYDPATPRIAGAVISGSTPISYETVRPSKGPADIARVDSPEVKVRHPDYTAPLIATIETSPFYPTTPFAQDQQKATQYNSYVKNATNSIAASYP